MIYSFQSSLRPFKEVTFRPGLNLIIIETDPASSQGHTRNSAGKTSLVELLHFLTGGDTDKDSLFRHSALEQHSFTGEFNVSGNKIAVERSGSRPSKLYLGSDSAEKLPGKASTEKASGRSYVTNSVWKRILGHCYFDLPLNRKGTGYGKSYTPSFRSMLSYFARRRNSGGFLHPERHSEAQQRYDYQINLSYLLGVDWRIPWRLQGVRSRERSLKELAKIAGDGGTLKQVMGTVAELRPKLTIAERRARELGEQLARFEVHESYRELSVRAAKAKTEMQQLARQTVTLKETLEHLEQAIADEKNAEDVDIDRLYRAAGVQLPELTLRRIEDVRDFYHSVVKNRKLHLQEQITDTAARIAELEARVGELDAERSNTLRQLEGKGALEDFVALQKKLAEYEAEVASLRERFRAAELLEGEATQLDIDRKALKQRLQRDHTARVANLEEAIIAVSNVIGELYDDRTGDFVVEATENGPEFRISIEGDRGGGISNMEIFSMDMALVSVVAQRVGGPGFLMHDSHLFDGVDSRQIARAIEIGSQVCSDASWQYIVMLNSDVFETLRFSPGFEVSEAILPLGLSDKTETGGLFGMRF